MIVHCPSCSTRYRHVAVPESLPASAHCSECDETFPLTTPRRPYLVLSGTNGAGRMTIGMDDPGLAAQVRHGGPERDGSTVLSYAVLAPEDAMREEPSEARDVAEPQLPSSALAGPSTPTEPEVVSPGPVSEETPAPQRRRSVLREALVAGLPACACAGLAYYLGGDAGSPWVRLALGGVVGLVVGWGCLRWTRPVD